MRSPSALPILSTAATAVSLALLLVIPAFSITSDPNHMSTLEFCTIDASNAKVDIGRDELVGLPDMYDFSRHKQVYKVFLFNYCSGTRRVGSGYTVIDFCSSKGQEIWDLLDPWSIWGVKLKPDGSASFRWLDGGPDWLWIAYVAGIALASLSLIFGVIPVHRVRWAKWPIIVTLSLTAIVQLAIAISAQVTYSSLVGAANDEGISITAKLGVVAFMINWIAALCSVLAATMRFANIRHIEKEGARAAQHTGLRQFLAGSGAHKYTEVDDVLLQDRNMEADNPRTTLGNFQEAKYEPYRPTK